MSTQSLEFVKDQIRRHWDRRAPTFDAQKNHGIHTDQQKKAWIDLFTAVLGPRPLDVLDVGCGTGFLSLLLAEQGHSTTGIDFAKDMLDEARRKAEAQNLPAKFLPGDAEHPPEDLGTFDLVCMRHVIWTLPNPALAAANWKKRLKPGGRILLIEGKFAATNRKDEYAAIVESLPFAGGQSADDVIHVLEGAGFDACSSQPLMDTAYWIDPPLFSRYLVTATNPG